MKKKITYYLKFLYYKAGFFPPERILTPKQLQNNYKYSSHEIKEYFYNKHTNSFFKYNDMKGYTTFLKDLMPNNKYLYFNSKFLFKNQKELGKGTSSLNIFRKIKKENIFVFEKIYFSNHEDLKRILTFYKECYNIIKNEWNVPILLDIVRSTELTALYFEYTQLHKNTLKNEIEKVLINITLSFIEKSKQNSSLIERIMDESIITSYKNHYAYKRYNEKLEKEFLINNINTKSIGARIKKSPKVISHGDLHENNVFGNSTIIDWDNFGLYPIGFDIAFVYYRTVHIGINKMDLKSWLTVYYKNYVNSKDWHDLEYNVCYFVLLFTFLNYSLYENLRIELFSYLKELMNEN